MKLNIAEIFTICTGILYTENLISDVYRVLNGLLSENLMIHHLPIASKFVVPQIMKKLPDELQTIINNWQHVDNWKEVINNYQNRFGNFDITVDKTGFEDYMIGNSLLIKWANNHV